MSWAILELARHPAFQKKLQAELDGILQEVGGIEKIGYNDLFRMTYLTAVINETLRLAQLIILSAVLLAFAVANNSSYS